MRLHMLTYFFVLYTYCVFATRQDAGGPMNESSPIEPDYIRPIVRDPAQESAPLLQIELFTESLCPDCIKFMTTSLSKALEAEGLFDMANITLYPYGNAYEKQGNDGEWIFTCQHGPTECYGNLLENCAKSYYDVEDFFEWLVCVELNIEGSGDFNKTGQDCALKFKLSFDEVRTCASNRQGNALMHEAAIVTNNLNPPHTYVPWFTVNGTHDISAENWMIVDMLQYICMHTQAPKSPACA